MGEMIEAPHGASRRSGRKLVMVTAVLVMATTLVACQNGKVGGKCKPGAVAQDATHVLICKNKRWTRLISKADGMRELTRIQAEQKAEAEKANQPAPTAPPATAPAPTAPAPTAPPATAPPATVPPVTAAPVTAPPTTAPATTTTTAAPATTTTTVPVTTTTRPTTTTVPVTTTTRPPTTTTTTVPATTTTSTTIPATTTTSTTVPSTTTTTIAVPPTTSPQTSGNDLDTTFGTSGTATLGLPAQGESIRAVASGEWGTTYFLTGSTAVAKLRRLNATGGIDTTFGANGSVDMATYCAGCGLGVDGLNRAYMWTSSMIVGQSKLAVTRYLSSGQLDAGYGTNGTILIDGGYGSAVAVNDDGTVAVATSTTGAAPLWLASPTGAVRGWPALPVCNVRSATFDSADRVLVAGRDCTTSQSVVARYLGTGQDDPGFGTSGHAVLPVDMSFNWQVLVDSSDRPYLVQDRRVQRLTITGAIDTSYGQSGGALLPAPSSTSVLRSAAITSGGVAGLTSSAATPTSNGLALSRLDDNGAVDSSFGTAGVLALTQFTANSNTVSATVNLPTMVKAGAGYIVMADTYVSHPSIDSIQANGFVKVMGSGSFDQAFGTAGMATLRTGQLGSGLNDTAPGPGGTVYVTLQLGNRSGLLVARMKADGTGLDTTFSGDGLYFDADAAQSVVDAQGRVVIYRARVPESMTSFGMDQPTQRRMIRLTTAGAPDTGFGSGGTVAWPDIPLVVGMAVTCGATLVALPDGGVVVSYGTGRGAAECSTTGLDKVSPNGVLSANWGSGLAPLTGIRTPRLITATSANGVVMVLAEGAGYSLSPTNRVVRLTASGAADPTFGAGGMFDITDSAMFNRIDELPDGGVLLVEASASGMSFGPGPTYVRRYGADGVAFTGGGFAPAGRLALPTSTVPMLAGSRIVATGWLSGGSASVYQLNGIVDTNFPNAPGDDGHGFFTSSASPFVVRAVVSGGRLILTIPGANGGAELFRFRGTIG